MKKGCGYVRFEILRCPKIEENTEETRSYIGVTELFTVVSSLQVTCN